MSLEPCLDQRMIHYRAGRVPEEHELVLFTDFSLTHIDADGITN